MLNEYTTLVRRHPVAPLQSDYTRGLCSAGEELAVATHLEFCRRCAHQIDPAGDMTTSGRADGGPDFKPAFGKLPSTFRRARLGRWRGAAGGVRTAIVHRVSSLGEAVYLVEAANGRLLALRTGAELVVVVEGVIQDGPARYLRGDFLDLRAGGLLQEPRGGAPSGCVCLVLCGEACGASRPAAAD